jgi:hypothetical protein
MFTARADASSTTGGTIVVRTTGGVNIAPAAFVNTGPGPSTHAADYRQYGVTFNSGSSVVAFVGYTTPGSLSSMWTMHRPVQVRRMLGA